ncbi:MAG: long-chain fatty acid--CoA ligase [Saprospiraceae bacterium]|nr:long-chain fatty acid--CoA ligase [Saprospiraceae bacterium]
MFNLSTILEHQARNYATKEAIVFADKRISYAHLNAAANQIANGLKSLGIGHGDKVALTCANLPYFPIIYFGILKAGATVVPLSVLLKRYEVNYHLQDSEAKAYFCFVGTPDIPMGQEGHAGFEMTDTCEHFFMITPQPTDPSPIEGTQTMGMLMSGQSPIFESYPTEPNDTAVIIYTSGTTGRPKGAELTHANLMFNAILSADLFKLTPQSRQLLVLPLFHIFGQTVQMLAGIYRGVSTSLVPRFDAAAIFTIFQNEKITHFAGVPTMYWGLLNYPDAHKFDLELIKNTLEICGSGGAALPVQVLHDFEAKFNVPILEGYGMSEGSPVVTFNQPDKPRKAGSVGTPVWGVEVCIMDENRNQLGSNEKGEICYRGHNVMKGYYKRPEATAESVIDGWLHSGDIGYRDEDGYYFIVDRTKDMIIRGGYNVYPREVEELIMQHPAVSMVAVIGVPHDQYGEEIKACVVLKPNAELSAEDLIAWSKDRIAMYKYPRIVEFLSSLPMSASGKILKRELRTN